MERSPNEGGRFPTTIPQLVARLTLGAGKKDPAAWEEFYARYARPLVVFAALDRRLPLADAEDLVQSFLAYLLEQPRIEGFDQELGRFRTYLLTLLKRFHKDERAKAHAQKRGAGRVQVGGLEERIDRYRSKDVPPDKAFAREWALGVVRDAVAACAQEMTSSSDEPAAGWFDARYAHLFDGGARPSRQDAIARLGLTEGKAQAVDKRVRALLRDHLERHVRADLVRPEGDNAATRALVDEGLRELLEALAEGTA